MKPCLLLLLLAPAAAWAQPLAGKPWTRHTIDASSRGAAGVKLIDINTDGRPDVVTAWQEGGVVRVYYNEGRVGVRSEWPRVTVGNLSSPNAAVFADLDANLAFDVVAAAGGDKPALSILWAPSDFDRYFDPSAWTSGIIAASQGRMAWTAVVPVQIDGRNSLDLVVGGRGAGAAIGWLEAPANPRDLAAWR